MMEKLGISVKEMNNILNKKSGVFGITDGKYTDRRDVEIAAENADELANIAIEIETIQVEKVYCSIYGCPWKS